MPFSLATGLSRCKRCTDNFLIQDESKSEGESECCRLRVCHSALLIIFLFAAATAACLLRCWSQESDARGDPKCHHALSSVRAEREAKSEAHCEIIPWTDAWGDESAHSDTATQRHSSTDAREGDERRGEEGDESPAVHSIAFTLFASASPSLSFSFSLSACPPFR